MSTATSVVSGIHFEQLMAGVDPETRKSVEDMLVFFANDADTSTTAEKLRADKLRTAYNNLVDFLVSNKLNDLNQQQMAFFCTGAIGDNITIQAGSGPRSFELLPADIYGELLKTFSVTDPAARPLPVYSVLDKFTLIAKNEILPMTMGKEREKA